MNISSELRSNEPSAGSGFPAWARIGAGESSVEEAAFSAGAALAALNPFALQAGNNPPSKLWRQRLALPAAAAINTFEGRREDAADIRDNWYLTKPGDDYGPACHTLNQWRQLGRVGSPQTSKWSTTVAKYLQLDFDEVTQDVILTSLAIRGDAVASAAYLSARILQANPKAESLALWMADAMLARRLKWWSPVPLLPGFIIRKEIHAAPEHLDGNSAWLKACYLAYAKASGEAYNLVNNLSRQSQNLQEVLPKLRAKSAGAVVQKFLTEDAVMPASLTNDMSERSARRICDRLVSLGVVRELTGRSTSRLYGL